MADRLQNNLLSLLVDSGGDSQLHGEETGDGQRDFGPHSVSSVVQGRSRRQQEDGSFSR